MDTATLLADPNALRLEAFVSHENAITVLVRTCQSFAVCPLCQQPSNSLHSNYVRRIADLPWHGVAVSLELHARKMRCRNECCSRKVFCERLPNVAAAMGRKTCRLNAALTFLAFALGGEAGARTARKLNLEISGDTLLRRIRQQAAVEKATVKVLGVDDFAFRRGERYGTILVDLEKRQPVDLLPDREAKTLEKWLTKHPEVEIISRDRSGAYAAGTRAGAPQAAQVADRFHLLKNLLDGFEKFLARQHQAIAAAFGAVVQPRSKSAGDKASPDATATPTATQQLAIELKAAKQTAHEQRFQAIKQMRAAGVPILQIARRLRMSRNTVKKFLAADSVPPLRAPYHQRFSPLHRFVPYLQQRWIKDGARSSRKLWKEIKAQGYDGAEVTLRHYLQRWRALSSAELAARCWLKSGRVRAPSTRQVKWLLFGSQKKSGEPQQWEQPFIKQLCRQSAQIAAAQILVREFYRILTHRQPVALQLWLEKARASKIGEFIWFANGVEQDAAAVEAACSSQWSQGQVEGQVNRLKFLKRQMFGRAKFDLLRARVLNRC